MPNGLVKSIFNEKKNLYDAYPYYPGIPSFDLERKHMFYGKIDKESDVVFWDTNFTKQIESARGGAAFVMDVVADAFNSLRANYRRAIQGISRGSVYHTSLKAYKSSTGYGLDFSYASYMQTIYKNFVERYVLKNRNYEKIKNYKDFTKEFIRYSLRSARNYPITTSGFITSMHCKPFVSGLMIETSPRAHGIENNKNIFEYLKDPYYEFWIREVQKFGFMVDRNAPWRLVFNLGSGWSNLQQNPEDLKGAQLFLNNYGLDYESVFDFRFEKAYKYDLILLRNIMESMYSAFYKQFSTYEQQQIIPDSNGRCHGFAVKNERLYREIPNELTGFVDEDDEYWLRALVKLRFAEANFPHTDAEFKNYVDLATKKMRLFGVEHSLRYVNGLTKGFFKTQFALEGGYWQGQAKLEYDERIKKREEEVNKTSGGDYVLTGTKNIVR